MVAAGLLVAIIGFLATSRDDLNENVQMMVDTVGGLSTVVGFAVGAVLSGGYCWLFVASRRGSVLDDEGHRREFRAALKNDEISVVKMFGYTGETALADLLDYSDRYRPLTVRLLLRNWLVERHDQERHNARADTSNSRLWDKADSIRAVATERWTHAMQRELRFYDGPPVVKASLLLAGDRPVAGFVTFFCWQDVPENGGSAFKGVPRGIVHLVASRPNDAAILKYLDSQFELAWRTAAPREVLLLDEMRIRREQRPS